jgi:phage terminase large subunit-like protein
LHRCHLRLSNQSRKAAPNGGVQFPELEAELCGLVAGGGYEGPGRSPDRADAMVWALSELLPVRATGAPRVKAF